MLWTHWASSTSLLVLSSGTCLFLGLLWVYFLVGFLGSEDGGTFQIKNRTFQISNSLHWRFFPKTMCLAQTPGMVGMKSLSSSSSEILGSPAGLPVVHRLGGSHEAPEG